MSDCTHCKHLTLCGPNGTYGRCDEGMFRGEEPWSILIINEVCCDRFVANKRDA